MKLTILIVNWNSTDAVASCLNSIQEHASHLEPQVVVVDSGSFDGCAAMLSTRFPEVEFLQSPVNIGFGRCNNLGFTRAIGEWLLLLNPDTLLQANSVDYLINALVMDPDAWLAGAKLCHADGCPQLHSVHRLPTPWNCATDCNLLRRRHWRRTGIDRATEPVEVDAVSGACMMMRNDVFRRLGGFDPGFFMYAEDMDLCRRIRQHGRRILHVPQAVVIHQGGGCSPVDSRIASAITMRRALDRYFRIHFGWSHVVLHHLLVGITAMLRLMASSMARPVRRDPIRAKSRAVLSWSLRIPRSAAVITNEPRVLVGETWRPAATGTA
jgi:GT2 family glycosyltransferase